MKEIKHIVINKNRGWRGLAEIICMDKDMKLVHKMIFSFSQLVWNGMLNGMMVVKDTDNYYVLHFNNLDHLPSKEQQRSVLIKHFMADVESISMYSCEHWMSETSRDKTGNDYTAIRAFITNRNNHTTSDWNYIGVRVTPAI